MVVSTDWLNDLCSDSPSGPLAKVLIVVTNPSRYSELQAVEAVVELVDFFEAKTEKLEASEVMTELRQIFCGSFGVGVSNANQ